MGTSICTVTVLFVMGYLLRVTISAIMIMIMYAANWIQLYTRAS